MIPDQTLDEKKKNSKGYIGQWGKFVNYIFDRSILLMLNCLNMIINFVYTGECPCSQEKHAEEFKGARP